MSRPPKFSFLRWQASVALIGAILIAIALGLSLWHSYISNGLAASEPDAHQERIIRNQPFAGSIWTSAKEPIPGVKVSIVINKQVIATTVTDHAGRFSFHIDGPPQGDLTLTAQKSGFQSQKLYANLGDTDYQFTLSP